MFERIRVVVLARLRGASWIIFKPYLMLQLIFPYNAQFSRRKNSLGGIFRKSNFNYAFIKSIENWIQNTHVAIYSRFVCILILTPPRVAIFFERSSPFTHTILYRYRLINRCQPIPVWFSGLELAASHLESALDEQL